MTRTVGIGIAGALALALAGAWQGVGLLVLARLAVSGGALAAAAAVDLREHRIPNRLVLPAAVACFMLAAADQVSTADLAVALAFVAVLLVVTLAWPAGLGMGDVKLALLVAGGLDGRAARALAAGLLLAAIAGVFLLVRRGRAAGGEAIPLGPFIAAGSLLAVIV